MTWVIGRKLINSVIRSRDDLKVGVVAELEVDVKTWQVKAIKTEASRPLLERLHLDEPSITGGRMVYIDTSKIDRFEDGIIYLNVDARDLAELRWKKMQTMF
ncbi:MAG: hypothetical protein DRJ42_24275 [Deltaproteobacteria bacterium]|nr:MAG: hypothetical protein DRJ42_24275 [Deltaproteobacteria bacterium]